MVRILRQPRPRSSEIVRRWSAARPTRAHAQRSRRCVRIPRRESALERDQHAILDRVYRPHAVHFAILWRPIVASCRPLGVIGNQWLGLGVIDGQTLVDRVFLIVFALNQWLAGHVVTVGDLGWVVLHVISATGAEVYAPPAHAFDNGSIG